MANYKESELTGTVYTRCNSITIRNPLEGIKQAVFNEEVALVTDTGITTTPVKDCALEFTNDGHIDLYNPATGEVVGSMPHTEVYKVIYSMYLTAAYNRDNSPSKYLTEEELNNILNNP